MKRIYQSVKKKTILIVDDDQIAIHRCQEKLQSQGYKVEVADNGHKAMQKLKKENSCNVGERRSEA